MGGIALRPLLIAEFTFWLRGLSIRQYLAARDPAAETVHYLMLVVRSSRAGQERFHSSQRPRLIPTSMNSPLQVVGGRDLEL